MTGRLLRGMAVAAVLVLQSCALPKGRTHFSEPGTLSGGGELRWHGREEIKLTDFDRLVMADDLKERDFPTWVVQDGIGEPALIYRSKRRKEHFVSDIGTALPVTLVRSEGVVHVCDVMDDDEFRGRQLAANFTAPLAYMRKQGDLKLPVVKAMLRSGRYLDKSGLYRFEPVDTDRIPVFFIHGLKSSPSIWKLMVNELRRDRAIRENYQFWSFSYPTGIPVVYAAHLLREELNVLQTMHNANGQNENWNHSIIVGHSMGGLVSRLQVTDSGTAFWDNSVVVKDRLRLAPKTEEMLKSSLIFERRPFIDRAVFMATPHGGSEVAVSGFGEFVSKLIKLPGDFRDGLLDTLTLNPQVSPKHFNIPTSIDNLNPDSDFIRTLKTLPINEGVTYHSIIASGGPENRTRETMNDGLVTYYSASLPGAASEVIVPCGHRAPNDMVAVAEMRRILKLNLKEKGKL